MKSIFSLKITRTCLEETVRKKGRCICLYIPVLWQSRIFSSLLMKVENGMCFAEQSNPLRTCLMRWRLVDDTVCGLKSQTTCVEEKIQIRKKLNSLFFFCFFSYFLFSFQSGQGIRQAPGPKIAETWDSHLHKERRYFHFIQCKRKIVHNSQW